MKNIYESIKGIMADSLNERAPPPINYKAKPPKSTTTRALTTTASTNTPTSSAVTTTSQTNAPSTRTSSTSVTTKPATPVSAPEPAAQPQKSNFQFKGRSLGITDVKPTSSVGAAARNIASKAISAVGTVARIARGGSVLAALEPSELASGELPDEKRAELEKGGIPKGPDGKPLTKPSPYTEPKPEPQTQPKPKPEAKPQPQTAKVRTRPTAIVDPKPRTQSTPSGAKPPVSGGEPPAEKQVSPAGEGPNRKNVPPFVPIDQNKKDDTKPQAAVPISNNVKPQTAAKPPASDEPKAVDKKEPGDDWVPSRRASDRPAPPPPPSAEAPKAEPKTVKPDWFVRTPGSPTNSGEAGYLTTKDKEGEVYPGTDIPRSAVMSGSGAAERAAQIRGHSVDKYEVGMAGPRYQHKGKWYSADPTDAEMEQKKKSQTTKEETQMSINKRYGVSDQLYSSVMEVLAKHKGTPPRDEKEKKLAAMHGDPNTITHGDVLKARGVKMKEEVKQVDEMSSKMKMKLGLYGKKKKTNEEAESIQEKNTDTPGNSYEHQCAIHVKNEEWGVGRTITTQHADPDESGNIAWYDVMFEHGIEKGVPTSSLEILVSESHMHSKRKKKAM
jgi:hypothetical protein